MCFILYIKCRFNIFPDQLQPILRLWHIGTRNCNNNVLSGIDIDDISAISHSRIDVLLSINDPPEITIGQFPLSASTMRTCTLPDPLLLSESIPSQPY